MSAPAQSKERHTEIRNAKAFRDYNIEEKFEAGLALKGTEVKSIRMGRAQLSDSFGRMEKGEAWLCSAHIDEYAYGTYANHDPKRPRKLLLHAKELRRIQRALEQEGRALVALALYFKGSLVKVRLALATGKQLHDRREDIKRRDQEKEIRRAIRFKR